MSTGEILSVAIAEDDSSYRSSLRELFTYTKGFHVAGVYASADDLIKNASPLWDVALMDIEMPGLGGIEGTRELKQLHPDIAVVMLTVFEEPDTVLRAICAGADGYLLKKSSASALVGAIREITKGGSPLSSGVAKTILSLLQTRQFAGKPKPRKQASATRLTLTDREQEVLRCLVDGHSYKRTSEALGISIETVRSHIKNLYRKLQVHNVAEAVTRAIRQGLV